MLHFDAHEDVGRDAADHKRRGRNRQGSAKAKATMGDARGGVPGQ